MSTPSALEHLADTPHKTMIHRLLLCVLVMFLGAAGARAADAPAAGDAASDDDGSPARAIVMKIHPDPDCAGKPYVIVGDYLIAASPAKHLTVYDLVTLDPVASVANPGPTPYLYLYKGAVRSWPTDHLAPLIELDQAVTDDSDPYDVMTHFELLRAEGKGSLTPSEACYRWAGRHFGPPGVGSIACYEEGRLSRRVRFNSELSDGEQYRVWLRGATPLGYSNHRVLELDDFLCPAQRLLDLPSDSSSIQAVASDGRTIAVLRWASANKSPGAGSGSHALEIYRPGVRSPIITNYLTLKKAPPVSSAAILPFAGGYLAVGQPLLWLHPDGRSWSEPAYPSRKMLDDFRLPPSITLTHHRIIMSDDSGVIYIIDPSIVLGRKVPPPSYEGGPKPLVQMLRRASTQPR